MCVRACVLAGMCASLHGFYMHNNQITVPRVLHKKYPMYIHVHVCTCTCMHACIRLRWCISLFCVGGKELYGMVWAVYSKTLSFSTVKGQLVGMWYMYRDLCTVHAT